MANQKGLMLLGLAAAGVFLFKDQLFPVGTVGQGTVGQEPTGTGTGTGSGTPSGTGTNLETQKTALREYLKGIAATDPHIQGEATDKYYWWLWLKRYFGIPGEPPLPAEITFFGDTELIPLETIVDRMAGFQVAGYGQGGTA